MARFRTHARIVALAWLLCQAASLSAFVPENCCAAHTPAAISEDCHETEPAAAEPATGDACRMHEDEGAACPMHQAQARNCCVMSNGCDGPNTQLASLFAFSCDLTTSHESVIAPDSIIVLPPAGPPLLSRLATPDAPPPKV
jgi:hypothetical protein